MSERTSRLEKSDTAFRTISEVSETLDVQQHVLRFWETKFAQVKPLKRGGNRRYYRPQDIQLLKYIHRLLYTEGYTIKGVQKLLKTQSKAELVEAAAKAAGEEPIASGFGDAEPVAKIVSPVVNPRDAAVARSARQRKILQAMLGDLVELRDNVRAARQASAFSE